MSCQPESKGTLISLKLDTGSEANMVPGTVVLALQKKTQMVERKQLTLQADSWVLGSALEIHEPDV